MTKNRLNSIDALRGVALLLMIIDHAFDWWLAEAYRAGQAEAVSTFLGTLAAPIFVTLVGVSLAISVERQRGRGTPAQQILYYNLRRGLFFIGMGYVVNFLVFFTGSNWEDVLALDVLHLIGLGIMTGGTLALIAGPIPLLVVAVVWAVGSSLYGGTIVLPGWIGTWANNNPGTNYFPALPWLAYVWFGIGVGKLAKRLNKSDNLLTLNSGWLLLIALGWFVLLLVVPNVGYRYPRLNSVCFTLGVLFVLWALLQRLDTLSAVTQRLIVLPLALFGQTAFMLYFFHHLIAHRLLYHLGLVTGRAWHGQYGTLNPTQALIGLIILIVLCYVAARAWLPVREQIQAGIAARAAQIFRR
jgi:uncharacterized membrane protein